MISDFKIRYYEIYMINEDLTANTDCSERTRLQIEHDECNITNFSNNVRCDCLNCN